MATALLGQSHEPLRSILLAGNAEVTYWDPTSSHSNTPAAWWFTGLRRTGSRRYRRLRLALSSLRYPLFLFEPAEGW
jgi:hypothetical protein